MSGCGEERGDKPFESDLGDNDALPMAVLAISSLGLLIERGLSLPAESGGRVPPGNDVGVTGAWLIAENEPARGVFEVVVTAMRHTSVDVQL